MATNTKTAMKRLNRLRKLAVGKSLEDYAGTNLNQNWKSIEDTFSSVSSSIGSVSNSLPSSVTSGSSGLFSTTSSSYVQPTNMSLSITVKKPNIMLFVVPSSDSIPMQTASGTPYFRFLRNGSQISELGYASNLFAGNLSFVDVGVTAGTHTYSFEVKRQSGSNPLYVYNYRLVAMELP